MKLELFVLFAIFVVIGSSHLLRYDDYAKIDSSLRRTLDSKGIADILVSFASGTKTVLDTVSKVKFATKGERATSIYLSLLENANKSQSETIKLMSARFPSVKFTSFWITNQINIKGATVNLIDFLATLDNVSGIDEEEIVYVDYELNSVVKGTNNTISNATEWGVEIISAQRAWETPGGNNGTGIVIATIDSGVRRTHAFLSNNFVGDFGWYDPYSPSEEPFDDNGHGTHVTGTICGSNGVGVAPNSKWAACKALRADNSGTSAALIACGQFFACPSNAEGYNCSHAPDIISNSWSINQPGGGASWFDSVISAWHAIGIIPVFANGNYGNACNTGRSPADKNVIAVGATTVNDQLSSFSSVGPSYYGEIKPDISAPGTLVVSAYHTGDSDTATMSGTSMACPHIAGVIALLKSRDRSISYNRVKSLLEQNTDTVSLDTQQRTCGGIEDSVFPNNHFGHGRVNAFKAIRALIDTRPIPRADN